MPQINEGIVLQVYSTTSYISYVIVVILMIFFNISGNIILHCLLALVTLINNLRDIYISISIYISCIFMHAC